MSPPRLALALDVDDLGEAVALARRLRRWCPVAKVGLQLFCSAGPGAVTALVDEGLEVFCDLKLHDIPSTVAGAAQQVGRIGARYLTLHAAGGVAMLRAGADALAAGAAAGGHPPPTVLAVTVLTSEPEASSDLVSRRAAAGAAAGCGGLVCAASDLSAARAAAPGLLAVVPGIRAAGGERHDQARVATARQAAAAGADLLVVGRALTAASDPERAAADLVAEAEEGFAGRSAG